MYQGKYECHRPDLSRPTLHAPRRKKSIKDSFGVVPPPAGGYRNCNFPTWQKPDSREHIKITHTFILPLHSASAKFF